MGSYLKLQRNVVLICALWIFWVVVSITFTHACVWLEKYSRPQRRTCQSDWICWRKIIPGTVFDFSHTFQNEVKSNVNKIEKKIKWIFILTGSWFKDHDMQDPCDSSPTSFYKFDLCSPNHKHTLRAFCRQHLAFLAVTVLMLKDG